MYCIFLAIRGFDPRTFGLWAQRASAAPNRYVCYIGYIFCWFYWKHASVIWQGKKKKKKRKKQIGRDRDRTCDRGLIRPTLYRLSYATLLLVILWYVILYSIDMKLSYEEVEKKKQKRNLRHGAKRELNPRPLVP